MRLLIGVNLSLGLTTQVFLECLDGLAGHHILPSLNTANKTERLAGQIGFVTTTLACPLHVMRMGRMQPAGIITLLSPRGWYIMTRVATYELSCSQEEPQKDQL